MEWRRWWLGASVAACSVASIAFVLATWNETNGFLELPKKLLVTAALGLGIAGAFRLRRSSRLWAVPFAAFLAGAPVLLDVWGHYDPPEGEEGCSADGFVPPRLGSAGQAWTMFALPFAGLAALAAGVVFLLRPDRRPAGAWCLLAVLAQATAWMNSAFLCFP